jgi:hypothetical protein
MRRWSPLAVLAAALLLGSPLPVRARGAITAMGVRAQILTNCQLEVSETRQASVSVNLRCAQETLARIELEAESRATGAGPTRPRRAGLVGARRNDPGGAGGGWITTSFDLEDDSWMPTAAGPKAPRPPADDLTVHVDF